ncbi:hypothetical protein [Salmonella phage SE4]|uniref:hypothetical protein n=1 Tax=Salmonella phage SE4 TaxID=2575328 RepID=UPI0011D2E8D7|nr:hypothetical protein HWC20_gp08 [Salmonella phage SE4]QEG07734.1 hypothetical protein [Salmonella phage SE4]
MNFAFMHQAKPEGSDEWGGTIDLIMLEDVRKIEFLVKGIGKQKNNVLRVHTTNGIIELKRSKAIALFREAYNNYLAVLLPVQSTPEEETTDGQINTGSNGTAVNGTADGQPGESQQVDDKGEGRPGASSPDNQVSS